MIWALLVLLVLGSGFYSGAEIALVSASRARLETLAAEGRRDARTAIGLMRETPRAIAAILVGTNLCNVGASALATAIAVNAWPERGAAIATLVLTPVVLVAGEVLPKAFFRTHATRLLRLSAGALRLSCTVFGPAVVVASGATRLLLVLLPIPANERRPVFKREDLENVFLFGAAHEEGEADPDAGAWLRMAGRALDLSRRRVTEAMVPLPSGRTCPSDGTVADAVERFRSAGGRYLAAVDPQGRVEGFVSAKNLLGEDPAAPIGRFVRPAYLVDPEDALDRTMRELRRHQQAIALVRDRGGATLGVVTAEDVFEEVVGELARRPRKAEPPGRD